MPGKVIIVLLVFTSPYLVRLLLFISLTSPSCLIRLLLFYQFCLIMPGKVIIVLLVLTSSCQVVPYLFISFTILCQVSL